MDRLKIYYNLNSSRYPIFQGDFSKVEEVSMGEHKTSSQDKPILATYGLATCIGILAYNLDKNFAFLAHSDSFFSMNYQEGDSLGNPSKNVHINRLYNELREGRIDLIEIKLVSNNSVDKRLLQKTKEHINKRFTGEINLGGISEILNEGSIAFDIRDRKIYSYDPSLNNEKEVIKEREERLEHLTKCFACLTSGLKQNPPTQNSE